MSNWRRGQYKHFFRQILWHAPSMTARPVTLWGRCQPATASPFLCLWLDYSCQLVNVLIEAQLVWKSANLLSWRRSCTIGSTVMVITALTTIAQQLISDCKHYGIDALSSNQASGRTISSACREPMEGTSGVSTKNGISVRYIRNGTLNPKY